jgi:hypothetical protein
MTGPRTGREVDDDLFQQCAEMRMTHGTSWARRAHVVLGADAFGALKLYVPPSGPTPFTDDGDGRPRWRNLPIEVSRRTPPWTSSLVHTPPTTP